MTTESNNNNNNNNMQDVKTLIKTFYNHNAARYEEWALGKPSPRQEYLAQFLEILPASESTAAHASNTSIQATSTDSSTATAATDTAAHGQKEGDVGRAQVNVLELGCGTGEPCTRLMLESGIYVTGVDISTGMLDILRNRLHEKHAGKLDLVCADISTLKKPEWEGTFNGMAAFYTLISVPRQEIAQIWRNIGKWLKPGGLIVCNLGVKADEEFRDSNWLGTGYEMRWSSWSIEENLKILREEAGVEVLSAENKPSIEDGVEVIFLWVLARKKNDNSGTR